MSDHVTPSEAKEIMAKAWARGAVSFAQPAAPSQDRSEAYAKLRRAGRCVKCRGKARKDMAFCDPCGVAERERSQRNNGHTRQPRRHVYGNPTKPDQ